MSKVAQLANAQAAMVGGREPTSWAPVSLEAILAGEHPDPAPTILARTDGLALLYAGKLHALHGESESGKTWIALAACAERLAEGEQVLYLDFEDGPQSVIGRLLALSAPREAIRERFRYVQSAPMSR